MWDHLYFIAGVLFVVFLFSWLVGRSRPFLNGSSLHALYTARLVRAFLGASNPERYQGLGRPVIDVVPDDDIAQEHYWQAGGNIETAKGQVHNIYTSGAPIHLLNVTINETYGGRSQVEQRDRKGTGMAVGPAGMSAGVAHHVVFSLNPDAEKKPQGWEAILELWKNIQSAPHGRRVVEFWKWWRALRATIRPGQYSGVKIYPPKSGKSGKQFPGVRIR
jgi:hypothetical protein